MFLFRLKVLWLNLSPAQGGSGMCEAGSSTLEELVKMRKATSALRLQGNGGISPLWWKSECAEVAGAYNEGKEHGGSEQRHLAAGVLERTEEGQAGTGGCNEASTGSGSFAMGKGKWQDEAMVQLGWDVQRPVQGQS